MADEQELELDLDSALPEKKGEGKTITLDDKGDEVKADEATKQQSPEDTISELKKEIEASRARESQEKERANRLEAERATEVKKATSAIDEVYRARETSLETAIAANNIEIESLTRQLEEAREKGEIKGEIAAEKKLMKAIQKETGLEWEKNRIATEKTSREEAVKNAVVEQPVQKFTPREQAWIDANPRYNTDDEFQSYVWSVDSLAKRKGILPNTDAYFEFMDARVKKMFPEERAAEEARTERKTAPASSTAAPPSRSGDSGQRGGTNGKQIRLTADELEAADYMGMTPAEYAKEKYEIEQEKKVGRA